MSQSFESVKKYLPYFFDVTTNYYYRNSENRDKILSGGNEMRPSKKEGKYKVFTDSKDCDIFYIRIIR